MGGASVLWAETPDEDRGEDTAADRDAEAHIDESFAARRLRRWLKGMFGGKPPAEGARGNQEAPPAGEPDR
jgi:hypothetical protein